MDSTLLRGHAVALALFASLPAGGATSAQINALLCDPSGWEYDRRLVSMSRQARRVHGGGPGLLFQYTRRSKDLWKEDGKFDNQAYRPHATKRFPALDLSAYNELSFWVYIEGNAEEGFRIGFTSVVLRTSLRHNEWVRLRWHFAEDERIDLTSVTSFYFQGMNQGTPPSDAQEAKVYLSDFRLHKTPARHIAGWEPDPNEILLPYSAFYPGEEIAAPVASRHAGKRFSWTGPDGKEQGQVSTVIASARTEHAEVRLRAPKAAGKWRVMIEDGPSAVLLVAEHPYDQAIGKVLTAARAQRCGCASELHGPCHLDDAVRQDTGQQIDVVGGWHDEGASQFVRGTVMTTSVLARYRRSHGRPFSLGLNEGARDDLLAEVEWGARTLLKYEIEPGLFLRGWVQPFWCYTDGRPGTGDERRVALHHFFTPFYRWSCIEALALCSSVLDEPLSGRTRAMAARMWDQSQRVDEIATPEEQRYWKLTQGMLQAQAAQLAAALELFRLTGERQYADEAARVGARLLELQDRGEPEGDALYGYFYRTTKRRIPFNGAGNCRHKDVPGRVLAELLMVLPGHADASAWRGALRRHAEGTLKPLARMNAPYGYPAAGPFKRPITDMPGVTMAQTRGDMLVYPIQFASRGKRGLGSWESRVLLESAAAMAAMGRVLGDEELTRMAHAAVRYVLGANPFHVSYLRRFGARWPELAQLPNVQGMTLMYLGFTPDGRPYYNPYGTSNNRAHPRFCVQKEGTTFGSACLMLPCAYLESSPL